MDSAAFLTVLLIITIFALLGVVVYLFVILRQAHQSLRRLDKIITRVDSVTEFVEEKVVRPSSGLVTVLGLVKEAVGFIDDIRGAMEKSRKSSKDE